MRKILIAGVVAAVTTALAVPASSVEQSDAGTESEYVVLYEAGATDAARAAIAAAGGSIVRENTAVGVAKVASTDAAFAAKVAEATGVDGVATNRVIGRAVQPGAIPPAERDDVETEGRDGLQSGAAQRRAPAAPGAEPLADLQWDMQQIHATVDGSYRHEQGDRRVLVGILDTGVDGSHPDIAPNFNAALSRNFTTDIPTDANGDEVDGPCEDEPDQSCTDPADVDENGHGTHVASTIGSPINGIGIAGVAPKVSLVNLRAGQDSGYFFLQESVDALTYAGDNGIDVVNMSYYIDPWLFNCTNNPADNPANQAEQRVIIEATQRALNYAWNHGVTLISSAGNEAIDYTETNDDGTSPDFASEPGEAPYDRSVDPSCLSLPSEGNHVISTSATGISTRKSYYSSYGLGHPEIAAPGGDVYDTPGGTRDITKAVLAAYPFNVGIADGTIDPTTGDPLSAAVVRDCSSGTCAYYQYLQGTSMASPHAVGVAALIVSEYGHATRRGGFGLHPFFTGILLGTTATRHACPEPRAFTYVRFVPQPGGGTARVESTQTCEGPAWHNGFYGFGIVDALRAVRPFG